jgi:hypothetical protein
MIHADAEHKIALEERLRTLEASPTERFAGRGIVICAGGSALFTNAYVLIHVLRNALQCRLPIEVWYFGSAEMSPRMVSLLRLLDAEPVDATVMLATRPAAISDGWQLKIYALMWSAFDEVLLLDADLVPTRDPACVFDWAAYRETGAVLWPDVVDLLAQNPIWDACGLPSRTVPAIESGQVLIHKARRWAALQVTLHLNERAEYYYRMIYGDKDSWLLGLLLTRSPHAVVPRRPAADFAMCLYQRDFEGTILFQHRTGAKWRYAGEQDELPDFAGMQACRDALNHLRRHWNGLVFHAPRRSAAATRIEQDIARQSAFILVIPGRSPEQLVFLSDGEIGVGSSADCRNWHCADADGAIELVLCDAFGPRWRFEPQAGGRWYGRAIDDATIEAYLAADTRIADAAPKSPQRPIRTPWPPPGGCYSSRDDAGS